MNYDVFLLAFLLRDEVCDMYIYNLLQTKIASSRQVADIRHQFQKHDRVGIGSLPLSEFGRVLRRASSLRERDEADIKHAVHVFCLDQNVDYNLFLAWLVVGSKPTTVCAHLTGSVMLRSEARSVGKESVST